MKDSFRKICPSCKAPNFYFREFCIMCDVALDRSGKVRPEPKVHNEASTVPPKASPFPKSDAPSFKPVQETVRPFARFEREKRRGQDHGKKEQAHPLHPGYVLAQIGLLALSIWALFVLPFVGLLMLVVFCVLFVLPVRTILGYFFSRRIVAAILILLLLVAGGVYWFVFKVPSEKTTEPLSPDGIASSSGRLSIYDMASQGPTGNLPKGLFYFIQELPWINTEGIKYVWPMPTRGVCEEFSRQNKSGQASGLKSSENCVQDKGQYDGFFRHEPNRDWYVTFQAPGKVANVGIFKLSERTQKLGVSASFQTVWLFVMNMLTVMENEKPPVKLTARIISPQGEMDIATGKLKR